MDTKHHQILVNGRRKVLLGFFVLFPFLSTLANSQEITYFDSLRLVIDSSPEDTNKLKAMVLFGWELRNSNLDSSILIETNALKLASDITKRLTNDNEKKMLVTLKKWMANAKGHLGVYAQIKGDYSQSLALHFEALHLDIEMENKKGQAKHLGNIGVVYNKLGEYNKSLDFLLRALKMDEELSASKDVVIAENSKRGIARHLGNIGIVYEEQAETEMNPSQRVDLFNKALDYYNRTLDVLFELGDKRSSSNILGNIGVVFRQLGDFDRSLDYYQKALEMDKETGNRDGIARHLGNIGNVYGAMALISNKQDRNNLCKTALEYYFKSLKLKTELGNKNEVSATLGNIGLIYLETGNFIESEKYLTEASKISEEVKSLRLIKDNYAHLSELYERRENWQKAFEYYKKSIVARDSISNNENTKKRTQLEMQFEFDKKEAKILAEQEKKDALANAEIRRIILIRNSIFGLVGLAGIFTLFLVRSHIRRRKSSFEKKVSEVEMKALRSQMNPHFIFNSLQSVKKYILDNAINDAAEYLSKFASLMRMILENSRKHEVPLEKDLSALELYMQLESLRFQNRFKFIVEVDPQIDKEDTLIPPLLLQPFVENSIIHGISSRKDGMIKVKVMKEGNMIRCTVEDNGVGRDQSVQIEGGEKKKRESLGMKITQERLNIINQLKKVKTAVNIFDLKDRENRPGGLRVELLLPFETAF